VGRGLCRVGVGGGTRAAAPRPQYPPHPHSPLLGPPRLGPRVLPVPPASSATLALAGVPAASRVERRGRVRVDEAQASRGIDLGERRRNSRRRRRRAVAPRGHCASKRRVGVGGLGVIRPVQRVPGVAPRLAAARPRGRVRQVDRVEPDPSRQVGARHSGRGPQSGPVIGGGGGSHRHRRAWGRPECWGGGRSGSQQRQSRRRCRDAGPH